jgi:hypothetical protein
MSIKNSRARFRGRQNALAMFLSPAKAGSLIKFEMQPRVPLASLASPWAKFCRLLRRPVEQFPVKRAQFAAILTIVIVLSVFSSPRLSKACSNEACETQSTFNLAAFERARVLKAANQYLSEKPITITASSSPRSTGGLHDFFSEADYWWPDPKDPNRPYIQRDGMSNPDNFVAHRRALMRLSVQAPALVAAWKLTKDQSYARHAALHLRAWFIDERTRMNPNLQYAQAIHGRTTGRGTGIIDTIQLVEVVRAIEILKDSSALSMADLGAITQWFKDYLTWMTTSKNGIEERDAKNNHGTCWVMQVAEFARLTGNQEFLSYCRDRFKTVLVPNQIAADGSFPEELRRTKPYGYSLFNLEAMATVAEILSTRHDNLWTFELADGRGLRKAVGYMATYIKDKKSWPLSPDVMYDDQWPMRQSSLLFTGRALNRADYLDLWKRLPADSNVEEVIRNFFIRQPVLWVD